MLKFWFKEFPQYPADHIDYWRTRLIAHALLITTCYFLILTVINIVTFNDHHLALLDGVGLLVSLGIFVWFRGTGKVDSASWALTILVTALILLFVVTAGGYSHSLFWASLIPPFAFFLIGRTWGTVISVCAFVVCAVLVFLQVEAQQSVTFNTGSLLNVIEVCIAHILLFRFYERTRSSAYQQLAIRNAEIIKMAEIDKLTGLFNRDKLDTVLAECMQSLTDDSALSVMIIDIDHFKSINDQYGHLEGDRVLSALAVQLKQVIRDSDIIARWGGEEFVVVCANTPLGEAMELAQRLRKGIAKHATAKKSLTISIGVAENCVGDSAESLLDRADNALYRAKREGRNQVFTA